MNEPSRVDPVVTGLSELVGGPPGRRYRPHSWWTPVRVLLAVFTVVFALGLVQKYPCGATNWSDNDVRYRSMCYSDVPYLYTGRGFAEQRWPYADDALRYGASELGASVPGEPGSGALESAVPAPRYQPMEYPVLISYFAWAASKLTALVPSGPAQEIRAQTPVDGLWGLPGMAREVNTYFLITAFLLMLCGLGAVFFLSGASPGRPWDAMAFAASPVLLVGGLVNWDLLAVLFTAGALWAWSRDRPLLAGVLVGLGFATKLYPIFLLGAFLIDAIRRKQAYLVALSIATGTFAWIVVNVPAILGNLGAWKVFWTFNSDRAADLGSLWLVLEQRGVHTSAHGINVVSGAGFAFACAGIFFLGLAAERRPQVAQIAFLVVAAFLILNKVYSPQYVLWLLPLAVLARPRWRDLLIWQACELVYFGSVWLYLGGWLEPSAGTNPTAYQAAIVIRVLGELYLVALIVRDIWTAPPEPVALDRAGSADDDLVDVRGREPDRDLDRLADLGHRDA